jgi:hypothetical protein
LHPSALLSPDQFEELTDLDARFYAHCHLSDLPISVIPATADDGLCRFGYSRLPYVLCTLHLPTSDAAGQTTQETVCRGMMITPSPEWHQALKSLRAMAAVLEAKPRASGECEKRKRGRPAGSKTQTRDRELYLDWKAAQRATGITKLEFLQERGLPASDLAAIERGRKQEEGKNRPGKKARKDSVKPR